MKKALAMAMAAALFVSSALPAAAAPSLKASEKAQQKVEQRQEKAEQKKPAVQEKAEQKKQKAKDKAAEEKSHEAEVKEDEALEQENKENQEPAEETSAKGKTKGKKTIIDKKTGLPIVIKEEGLVIPVKAIVKGMKADVEWNAENKVLTIVNGDKVIEYNLTEKTIMINGQQLEKKAEAEETGEEQPKETIVTAVFKPLGFFAKLFSRFTIVEKPAAEGVEEGSDKAQNEEDAAEGSNNDTEEGWVEIPASEVEGTKKEAEPTNP